MEKFGIGNPPACPYCTRRARLVGGDVVYPGRGLVGFYWICTPCDAWVGTHKNSQRFAPLGTLANAELRRARMTVHALLDPIWKNRCTSRHDAYRWLARQMNRETVHVGSMMLEDCAAAVVVLEALQPDPNEQKPALRNALHQVAP